MCCKYRLQRGQTYSDVWTQSCKSFGELYFKRWFDCKCKRRDLLVCSLFLPKLYRYINCSSLASLNLPESLKEIGECSFNVTSLTEITIPSGITEIPSGAFANGKWEEVTIPGTVK